MRKLKAYATVIVLFICVSCTDQDLTKVAKALRDIDQGILVATQTTKAAHQAGVLSDESTDKVMTAVIKIVPKAKEANRIVRSINTLDPVSRGELKSLLLPLIEVVSDVANDPTIAEVKNPNSQVALKATLTGILTSLTIIRSAL